VHKGVLAFWRGVSTSEVGVVDIRFLRFDSDGLEVANCGGAVAGTALAKRLA
jgi:hypothetical protein